MYTIAELVAAAYELGYAPFLVSAALRESGKEIFTLEEARVIIESYARREVE